MVSQVNDIPDSAIGDAAPRQHHLYVPGFARRQGEQDHFGGSVLRKLSCGNDGVFEFQSPQVIQRFYPHSMRDDVQDLARILFEQGGWERRQLMRRR
jgi:hypothetical protein